jgi:dihydroorotase
MTLYLTDNTPPEEIDARRPAASSMREALPGRRHHQLRFRRHRHLRPAAALEAMAEAGLPLLVHGEVTDPDVDVFDREAVFIERHLAPLLKRFPQLKVVLEHITTAAGHRVRAAAPANVAGTITAHHLLLNRNAMFRAASARITTACRCSSASPPPGAGGRGHQRQPEVLPRHRQRAARPGRQGSACGCAGMYTAHAAIELYAEAFEAGRRAGQAGGFASHFGPDFYGLPRKRPSRNWSTTRAPSGSPPGCAAPRTSWWTWVRSSNAWA